MERQLAGGSAGLVRSILKQLGHDAPDEEAMLRAIRAALRDAKVAEGLDPDSVQYKLAVPIPTLWIKQFS